MSEVSDAAVVRMILADYAAADSANKLNMVGAGLSAVGFDPRTGLTAPFGIVVSVRVPPKFYDADCSVEIVLEDSTGAMVSLPTPSGNPQVMRIGQAVTFGRPNFLAGYVPSGLMGAVVQWVVLFSTGLPLAVGQRYVWRVKVYHESKDWWTEEFFVPGPHPGAS